MRRAWFAMLALALFARAGVARAAAPPRLSSAAAVLIDVASGDVLYAKSAYVRRSPASTTKILTAYVAVRSIDLSRVVLVSRQAAAVPGSSAHLRAGDRYTLGELLEGLLLPSGNDAAHAIAEAVAGDVPHFADRLNEAALRIGARQTHFVNPHGLTAPHHYTSARDLALIAQAALSEPQLRRIVASQELTLTPVGREGRTIRNTNRLLGAYLGADGAKTGTTNAAGKCLIASATRGETQLIAVVLKGGDRFGDAVRLLDFGFETVAGGVRFGGGTAFGRLRDGRVPRLAHELAAPRRLGRTLSLSVRLREGMPDEGGVAGVAILREDGKVLAAAPLLVPPRSRPWYLRILRRLPSRGVDPPSLHSL